MLNRLSDYIIEGVGKYWFGLKMWCWISSSSLVLREFKEKYEREGEREGGENVRLYVPGESKDKYEY